MTSPAVSQFMNCPLQGGWQAGDGDHQELSDKYLWNSRLETVILKTGVVLT